MLPTGLRAQGCPGDDAPNAAQITLGDPDGDGIWTPVDNSGNPITISGNNSGCTNVYTTGAPHNARRGRAGRDVFYRIILPACFDSLEVSLCGATWDTYLHVINATKRDTIDGDDNCGAGLASRIIAIGRPNADTYNMDDQADPVRDAMLLVSGDEIYIVVEGWGAGNAGSYTLVVRGYRQRPVTLAAPVISGPSSVCAGATNVTLDAPYPGGYQWRWYEPGNPNPIATSTTSSYTISGPINSSLTYTVEVDVLDPNGEAPPTCPLLGTTPLSDPFTISVAGVPADAQEITGPSTALWGQSITINAAPGDNNVGGTISLEYSTDGGNTWTAVSGFSGFPHTFVLPPLASGGPYTATYQFRTKAESPGCVPEEAFSEVLSVAVSDRPGNRAATAIPVTLNPSGAGTWTAVIRDSTDGLATSNEYDGARGARWATASRDLFFALTLPECLDSLVLNTCSGGTTYDTQIHLINATAQDTITNDDQGSSNCRSAGYRNPEYTSQLVAIGRPSTNRYTAGSVLSLVRDTMLLVSSHTYYIVVEGSFTGTVEGNFELTITGYKRRPSSINVSGAPNSAVCINSSPITLDATTPGATAYQWLDGSGNPIAGATSATYTVSPGAEGSITVTAQAIFNPNGEASCVTATDIVSSDPITITVEDTARAQIADAGNNIVSNQTLTIPEGSDVTLNAFSSQTDNSYTWKRYNSIPPSDPPDATSSGNSLTINNIAAGAYTIILEAVRGTGACDLTRDTVYLDVTSGLRADMGGFAIHPNPNTGTFTISAPAAGRYQVQVLDVAGRLVATEAFEGSTYQMRLSLPAGVYQVRLIQGDKSSTQRLIITE